MIPPEERLSMIEKFARQMFQIALVEIQGQRGELSDQEDTLVRVLRQIHDKMKQLVPNVCDYSGAIAAS